MCNCNCQKKEAPPAAAASQEKSYICYQCNTFKKAPLGAAAPECCGKKMEEMD
jgi:hypothetical protein